MKSLSAEEVAERLLRAADGNLEVRLKYPEVGFEYIAEGIPYMFGDMEIEISILGYNEPCDPKDIHHVKIPHVVSAKSADGREYDYALNITHSAFEIFNSCKGKYEFLLKLLKDAK